MRKGWEYKKLNEVCEKGASNIVINKLTDNSGEYPLFGASGLVKNIDFFHQDKPYIGIVKDGAGVGRVNIYPAYSSLVGTMQYIFPKEGYSIDFIKYFLVKLDLSHCVSGATIPHIYFKDYGKENIPTPSLNTQLAIVSELDKINELIRLKKEQLKDFDNLAQSLFYEMFGDPVENEKGWEVKKLIEVSSLINGRAYKQNELLSEGKYKVLRVGNFFTNSNFYYSNLELEDEKYCYKGDLLFAWSASFGAFIWDEDKTIFHYHIWRVLFDKAILDIHYYQYLLNTMTSFFMNDVHGIGMVHLTKSGMEQYELPLPPLSLQRLFAQRIEQIEREKSEVQKSIQDLETLLASRMQCWFE